MATPPITQMAAVCAGCRRFYRGEPHLDERDIDAEDQHKPQQRREKMATSMETKQAKRYAEQAEHQSACADRPFDDAKRYHKTSPNRRISAAAKNSTHDVSVIRSYKWNPNILRHF